MLELGPGSPWEVSSIDEDQKYQAMSQVGPWRAAVYSLITYTVLTQLAVRDTTGTWTQFGSRLEA